MSCDIIAIVMGIILSIMGYVFEHCLGVIGKNWA